MRTGPNSVSTVSTLRESFMRSGLYMRTPSVGVWRSMSVAKLLTARIVAQAAKQRAGTALLHVHGDCKDVLGPGGKQHLARVTQVLGGHIVEGAEYLRDRAALALGLAEIARTQLAVGKSLVPIPYPVSPISISGISP